MADASPKVQTEDRRARSGFRALIEEMMEQIRAEYGEPEPVPVDNGQKLILSGIR